MDNSSSPNTNSPQPVTAVPANSNSDSSLLKWVILGAGLALISFFLFRAILNTPESSSDLPNGFSHFGAEITSAFVGTGLTVAITALLLKFQTEKSTQQQENLLKQQNAHDVAMRKLEDKHNKELLEQQFARDEAKEKGITVFATKAEIYKAILEELGEITTKPVLQEGDFSRLTLLSLRVAYVADSAVISELAKFAEVLRAAVTGPNDPEDVEEDEQDKQITRAERRKILFAFSEVSRLIRNDLISQEVDTEVIRAIIEDFSKAGEIVDSTADDSLNSPQPSAPIANEAGSLPKDDIALLPVAPKAYPAPMTFEKFLNQCSGRGEREFFEKFIPLLQANQFVLYWTKKGFSIESTIRFHPSQQELPRWRSHIQRPVRSERRDKVEAALAAAGVEMSFNDSDFKFDWEKMQNATPEGFLEVVRAVLR